MAAINRNWEHLESAEYKRERALRETLIRLEKLEQTAAKFDRKVGWPFYFLHKKKGKEKERNRKARES